MAQRVEHSTAFTLHDRVNINHNKRQIKTALLLLHLPSSVCVLRRVSVRRYVEALKVIRRSGTFERQALKEIDVLRVLGGGRAGS